MKVLLMVCSVACISLFVLSQSNVHVQQNIGRALVSLVVRDEDYYFTRSYIQISDSMLMTWDSLFTAMDIQDNPFGMVLFFIDHFSRFRHDSMPDCFTLKEIVANKKSTRKSSILAVSAIMQKLGWDVQCFYSREECYLGMLFDERWGIRKGHWIDKDGKSYYLKEFDTSTPVGELHISNPQPQYNSLKPLRPDLKPLPLVTRLPQFRGTLCEKELHWVYQDQDYTITAHIPAEQIAWTANFPPSLYGMVAAGVEELENTGVVEKLAFLVQDLDEYNQVNFLLKFCQSFDIFAYDSAQPIKSVSRQLAEGKNDCDGRSVFLYCLLRTVLGYTDDDIMFVTWPNHLALGLKPRTDAAEDTLTRYGSFVGEHYYILDATYVGDTYWGSKMERVSDKCKVLK